MNRRLDGKGTRVAREAFELERDRVGAPGFVLARLFAVRAGFVFVMLALGIRLAVFIAAGRGFFELALLLADQVFGGLREKWFFCRGGARLRGLAVGALGMNGFRAAGFNVPCYGMTRVSAGCARVFCVSVPVGLIGSRGRRSEAGRAGNRANEKWSETKHAEPPIHGEVE